MKYISFAFSVLFLGFAFYNFYIGEYADSVAGVFFGAFIGSIFFYVNFQEKRSLEFLNFVLLNEQKLKNNAILLYRKKYITKETIVTKFWAYCSFIVVTFKLPSSYLIVKQDDTRTIGFAYSIVTLFLGWWSFPSGPIETLTTLTKNIRGGDKKNVLQLINEMKK
ncbi:hypothetical protein HYV57_01660 [Candidatus Peregrinibacteria bacterium]|nr:hypothetical protein [Candidatus Peregrinibacteria bacterium]